jgi:hypothetical protein
MDGDASDVDLTIAAIVATAVALEAGWVGGRNARDRRSVRKAASTLGR